MEMATLLPHISLLVHPSPPPFTCKSKTHLPIAPIRITSTKCPRRTQLIAAAGPSRSDSGMEFRPKNRKSASESGGEQLGNKAEENCKEGELVEALESLEEEAIMGEDEGREATDYNRRAHIFDACSKVFQDLKDPDASH